MILTVLIALISALSEAYADETVGFPSVLILPEYLTTNVQSPIQIGVCFVACPWLVSICSRLWRTVGGVPRHSHTICSSMASARSKNEGLRRMPPGGSSPGTPTLSVILALASLPSCPAPLRL